jgi:hypothetical protein
VRTKHKSAVLAKQQLDRERTEAFHDARALAIEIARGELSARFDPMTAGVVLQPGEIVYRQLPIWIRVQDDGRWANASFADVVMTDLRLLCRFATGRLFSLWWSGVIGLNADLSTEQLVLDFDDGQPVSLSGPWVAPAAVAGVALTYGLQALLTHPAMVPLRAEDRAGSKAVADLRRC